jgi:hypothetical protein
MLLAAFCAAKFARRRAEDLANGIHAGFGTCFDVLRSA